MTLDASEGVLNHYEETPCSRRDDGVHCECWWDGGACCACKDPGISDDEMVQVEAEPREPRR